MGNTPYILMVVAVLVFGAIMPQKGPKRKNYIILMTVLHTCLCGFRYMFITGDLHKYYYSFLECGEAGWFSDFIWEGFRNSGFLLFNKVIYVMFNGDFQVLLFCIALITHLILAYVVYRYSTMPWMSYLIWNCMTFYTFGFNSIRQSMAMSFVMLAFVCVAERKPKSFLLVMLLACSIHKPAIIFLPAYWLAMQRVNGKMLIFYVCMGIALFVFRNQFVSFIKGFYYDEDTTWIDSADIGSRTIMITGFALFGVLLAGLRDRDFEVLFHIMAVSAILQMLSGFDHIFTRLTDYYYQMVVLYLPMVFFRGGKKPLKTYIHPAFPFNQRSLKLLACVIVAFLLWYYYALYLNVPIANEVDNFLNYRSMWDVK